MMKASRKKTNGQKSKKTNPKSHESVTQKHKRNLFLKKVEHNIGSIDDLEGSFEADLKVEIDEGPWELMRFITSNHKIEFKNKMSEKSKVPGVESPKKFTFGPEEMNEKVFSRPSKGPRLSTDGKVAQPSPSRRKLEEEEGYPSEEEKDFSENIKKNEASECSSVASFFGLTENWDHESFKGITGDIAQIPNGGHKFNRFRPNLKVDEGRDLLLNGSHESLNESKCQHLSGETPRFRNSFEDQRVF